MVMFKIPKKGHLPTPFNTGAMRSSKPQPTGSPWWPMFCHSCSDTKELDFKWIAEFRMVSIPRLEEGRNNGKTYRKATFPGKGRAKIALDILIP